MKRSKSEAWSLWDTGPLSASENIGIDRALLKWKTEGKVNNILRFLQYDKPTVLIGYHQAVKQEVRLDYCNREGIDINRRITGGGTILFDSNQLGWELIFDRRDLGGAPYVTNLFKQLQQGFILGLKLLGITASIKGRNDIKVNGRKIAGTGGTGDEDSILFQGTFLIDFDVEMMLKALRIPVEKLKEKELSSARKKVISAKEILGYIPSLEKIKECLIEGFKEELGIEIDTVPIVYPNLKELNSFIEETKSSEWINLIDEPTDKRPIIVGVSKTWGGKVTAYLKVNLEQNYLEEVLFTGDFFSLSQHAINDLESELKQIPIIDVIDKINFFLKEHNNLFYLIDSQVFESACKHGFDKINCLKGGLSVDEVNSLFLVGNSFNSLGKIDHLLIPYCSKRVNCSLRYEKDCLTCGKCDVGELFSLAHDIGIEVETVINFEDLMNILFRLKNSGKSGFLGSCCSSFYLKHGCDIENVGVPGILVDMADLTCFDLKMEAEGRYGLFEREVATNIPLFIKILKMKF